jgi:hypothetical protein
MGLRCAVWFGRTKILERLLSIRRVILVTAKYFKDDECNSFMRSMYEDARKRLCEATMCRAIMRRYMGDVADVVLEYYAWDTIKE